MKIKKDMGMPVAGKKVLIVDEICDSGRTMACLKKLLEDRGAQVATCVLLDKKARRAVPVEPDYIGLDCPDEFGTYHLKFISLSSFLIVIVFFRLQWWDMEWITLILAALFHMWVFSRSLPTLRK